MSWKAPMTPRIVPILAAIALGTAAAWPVLAASPVTAQSCDPGYLGVCLPVYAGVDNVNCDHPAITVHSFPVIGDDPYHLDGNDNDGLACEGRSGSLPAYQPPAATATPTATTAPPTATNTPVPTATSTAIPEPTATQAPPTATATTPPPTATPVPPTPTSTATPPPSVIPGPPNTGTGAASGPDTPVALAAVTAVLISIAGAAAVTRRR